jgi:hypothetical protein
VGDPVPKYLSHLRRLVGDGGAEDFAQFEQHIYSQAAELRIVKVSEY